MTRVKKNKRRIRWRRLFCALILLSVFLVGLINIYQYIEEKVIAFNQPLKQPLKKVKDAHTFKGDTNTLGAINVLLLGSDSRGEKQSRTDTIMVAHYDPETHKIKLISLMRDMLVSVPEHGQQKLNAAYSFGGPELLRETIKENFGLDIHYYTIIDFKGFEKAVDLLAPNGIKVDIPYEMSSGINVKLEKGKQTLHGKELLGYVRFRHDRLSDFGRIQRQQEVISKLKEQAVSFQSVVKLPKILSLMNTYIDTNIDSSTLLEMGKDILTKKSSNIETLRIPEDGSFENKRDDELGAVLEVDFARNIEALNDFLGEKSVAQNE
ncbi:LCP family protein [Neobacillus cucumis]|uniref:Regulatory protein MsrR n=1 Tax=Neobacillus cucumis TaxID=1740721 RepID=A0A2N5HVS3_9BACI|nr:LCP family protein [Neobacillus cucumis]PLS09612.1 transcriptional regulator [Neobacillus cucumis]